MGGCTAAAAAAALFWNPPFPARCGAAGKGGDIQSCPAFRHIALLVHFMAKASYPGNMPAFFGLKRERITGLKRW
jgi:hypothetical protein